MKFDFVLEKAYGHILIPADDVTASKIEAWPNGGAKYLKAVGEVRNIGHHRKFFAMLKVAFDNLPEPFSFTSFSAFRKSVTIAAGYYEPFQTFIDGELIELREARSIAFDKMDQSEFEEFYNNVHAALCQYYGLDGDDFVLNFL